MKRSESPAPSLRRLVQFHVSLLIVLVFAGFSVLTYLAEHYTIRFSQDRRLRNIALSVPETVKDADLRSINIKLTHGRDDFVLLIWHGGRQVYRSHEDVDLARVTRPGFSMQTWRGEGWITYGRMAGPLTIQVAQSLDAREALAGERALHVIVPLLMLLPLAVLIIPVGVRRGLAPLTRMSQDLRLRDWHSLEPMGGGVQVAELVPLTQALDLLLERLGKAAQAQQAFIADASHELRTPLAALHILAGMLDEAPEGPSRQAALASLREGIARATRLSQQLLTTSRLDADHAAKREDAVSLRALVEEAIIALSPFASSKAMDLVLTTALDASLRANRVELSLLVVNLIENAIRYTPVGGRVAVSLATDPAALIVEDSGPGIAPDERDRVFDRFYRCCASEATGIDSSGSGLGLAIVAEVARRHHATVTLEDSVLGGLRVVVHFPAGDGSTGLPNIGNSQC